MNETTKDTDSTFFTVSPSGAGFTDQLLQFSVFYRLGLSLKYQYVHAGFRTERSGGLPDIATEGTPSPAKNPNKESQFNIHDYLGINHALESQTPNISIENLNRISVVLNDQVLEENAIETFEQLQAYVSKFNSTNLSSNILEFKLSGRRSRIFSLINYDCPQLADLLPLKQYSRIKPKDSLFASSRSELRILVHIRQGDTSIVKTPWDTWIPVRPNRTDFLHEYQNLEDIQQSRVFRIQDYYDFLELLLPKLKKHSHSIACFSDGFKRAFNTILSRPNILPLDQDQRNSLIEHRKTYDEKAFSELSKIAGCKLEIGESEQQLRQFVATIMDANVIITSCQQRMLQKFVAFYSNSNFPLVIVLHRKGEIPNYKGLVRHPKKRFTFVDIEKPNIKAILRRLAKGPQSLNDL